jgi:hypothetical protein
MSASDVEISDDVYILTAKEAEKHIEPPRLARLIISPDEVRIKPGTKQTFSVEALDQHGREIRTETIEWSATGGKIDQKGVFTAGEHEGNFLITAKSGGVTGSASVVVSKEKIPESPLLPPGGPKKLRWSGDVAPQKWTNLYMKVLTKLVSNGDLKIRVSIEANLKDESADRLVEETKTALRGLGLDDDVEAE